MQLYTLKLSPAIAHEWQARCIADVIPALADYAIEPRGKIMVDRNVVDAIVADCKFMADPKAIGCSPAERRAYRTMLWQCQEALTIGPVEVIEDPDAELIDNFNWVGSWHHY